MKRLPKTASALPFLIRSSRSGYSSGLYSRSASCTTITWPVAASIPRRTAAPFPRLRSCVSMRKPRSFDSFSRISRLPSVEASSTAMSSIRIGTERTRSTISSTDALSLYTGMTTLSSGSSSGVRRGWVRSPPLISGRCPRSGSPTPSQSGDCRCCGRRTQRDGACGPSASRTRARETRSTR